MPNYGDASYWDDRYSKQQSATFDWLESWEDLKETIERFAMTGIYTQSGQPQPSTKTINVKADKKILNLGCGNSIICEDMYDQGYKQIYNMDISSICIK